MSDYADERFVAVVCGHHEPEHENCRHAWNAAHPDDPVTEEEQREFVQKLLARAIPEERRTPGR